MTFILVFNSQVIFAFKNWLEVEKSFKFAMWHSSKTSKVDIILFIYKS